MDTLLAAALLPSGALDIGEFEELPARVCKAPGFQDEAGLSIDSV